MLCLAPPAKTLISSRLMSSEIVFKTLIGCQIYKRKWYILTSQIIYVTFGSILTKRPDHSSSIAKISNKKQCRRLSTVVLIYSNKLATEWCMFPPTSKQGVLSHLAALGLHLPRFHNVRPSRLLNENPCSQLVYRPHQGHLQCLHIFWFIPMPQSVFCIFSLLNILINIKHM